MALLVIRTFLLVFTHYRTGSTTKRFAVQFYTKWYVNDQRKFRDTVSAERNVMWSENEENVT